MPEPKKSRKLSKTSAWVTIISGSIAIIGGIIALYSWWHEEHQDPTPIEAKEQLQKLGVEMDLGGIGDAIRSNDAHTLKLFLIAGMNPNGSELQDALKDHDQEHEALVAVVHKYAKPDNQNTACPTADDAIKYYASFDGHDFSVVKRLCGNSAVIDKLKKMATRYEQAAAKASAASQGVGACRGQVQQLGTKGLLGMSRSLDDRNPSATYGWSNVQNAAYLLRMHYTSGMWKGDQAELNDALQVCDGVQQSSQAQAQSGQKFVSEASALRQTIARLQ